MGHRDFCRERDVTTQAYITAERQLSAGNPPEGTNESDEGYTCGSLTQVPNLGTVGGIRSTVAFDPVTAANAQQN
jgi:hypothetical protein